jgi:hypothetical protein
MSWGRIHQWIAAAAALCALAAPASAAEAADVPPNLVAPAPANARFSVETLGDGQSHLLLRFTGYIRNSGPGPLEIRGADRDGAVMTRTWQRIYQDTGSGYRDDPSRHPSITFENADGHEHWHVQGAARFSLWNDVGTAQVAPGAKVGFCLEDVERVDPSAPTNPAYGDSTSPTPRASSRASHQAGRTSTPRGFRSSGSTSQTPLRASTGSLRRSTPTTS